MCCFSPLARPQSFLARLFFRPRLYVADTNIFARKLDASTQALVYAMQLEAAADVAMILPLPVARSSGEKALEFVSLEGHSEFFTTLALLFHPPMPAAFRSRAILSAPQARAPLPVHSVGAFEASFVPTMHDFDRLDARFRMPRHVWNEIGGYDDYGFAVFRLAPGKKAKVHPMAFRFQTHAPSRLFFPTVHVHDGQVHKSALFDHNLYYQGNTLETDERAAMPVPARAHALLEQGIPVHRRRLYGQLPNTDTWIPLAGN